jgi:tetratricopeptide (TPR) repeat protein
MAAERTQLEQVIAHLETQRATLGDAVVDATIATLREKLAALPSHDGAAITARMIGRDAELQLLLDALYAVIEDRGIHRVTIVGEPGIGKSRLVSEFSQWLQRLPEPLSVFRAWADQRTYALPYALLRSLLAFGFQIQESDPAALARDKLERGVVAALGASAVEKAHFIGHLIGLDYSESPYLRGILNDAQQIRDRARHYAAQLFAGLSEQSPVVLILEDLHWADESSLEFLDHLAQGGPDSAILIIGTARRYFFDHRPAWGKGRAPHTRLDLQALSEQDSRLLVAAMLHSVGRLPAVLRDLIVARAEGNPFYMEELIKMLIADGVITTGPERWQVQMSRLEGMRVPRTLTEVMLARLEVLSALERTALEGAAVVGRIFWDSAVERLVGSALAADTGSIFDILRHKGLVIEQTPSAFSGEREYRFKHALLHEVVYAHIPEPIRQQYHAQVASWLRAWSGERLGTYAGLIAEHYERASAVAQAAEWYARAARQAHDTYATEAAISYYRKALALLPEVAANARERIALYEGLGVMLDLRARIAEALSAFTEMCRVAEALGDREAEAQAWCRLCGVQERQGNLQAVLESAGRAEELARGAGSAPALARALYHKGWALYRLGRAAEALAAGEQALALSTELQSPPEMARSLNLLGVAHELVGHYQQAIHYEEQALALLRELGDRRGMRVMLNNLGVSANVRGDYHSAIALLEESYRQAREIGDRVGAIYALSNLGEAQVGLGEYSAAEENLRRGIRLAEAGSMNTHPDLYVGLAGACLGQGKVQEALAAAQQGLALGRRVGRPLDVGAAWRAMGLAMAQLSDHIGAGPCFAESARIFTEIGAQGERARTLRDWARYEEHKGDRPRSQALWEESRELFERLNVELGDNASEAGTR